MMRQGEKRKMVCHTSAVRYERSSCWDHNLNSFFFFVLFLGRQDQGKRGASKYFIYSVVHLVGVALRVRHAVSASCFCLFFNRKDENGYVCRFRGGSARPPRSGNNMG